MKLPRRRQFLHLAAGAAALHFAPHVARAQAYPTRPVRIIVGFAPGGAADILARLLGQWLSDRLGQPFIVENRPGASSKIGTEAVVKAAPDGYTLLLINPTAATDPSLYDNLKYDFIRDIAPVASIARGTLAMVVNPAFPAKSVPEFIAYAKANPSKVNMAGGNGAPPHLAGELFNSMAGIHMANIPYRGDAPAITDLLGGQVQVYFSTLPSSVEHIKAGRLRALAVTTIERSAVLPDVPTVSEFLPGFEASLWNGVGAPRGAPFEIIERLNKEINSALVDPKIAARIADLGGTVLPGSAADFGKLIARETEKWGKVIRAAGIKPE
jgi:tripartite-type tricarboxylate transporter receptor subunit TctC